MIAPADLKTALPVCHTLYIGAKTDPKLLGELLKCMPRGGLVVSYSLNLQSTLSTNK